MSLRLGQKITEGLDANRLEIEFKTIPGGSYELGSNNDNDSNPFRTEKVDSFDIAETEMTNAQWRAGVGQLGTQNTLLVHYANDGKVTLLVRGTTEEVKDLKTQLVLVGAGVVDVIALGALKTINLGNLLEANVQTVTLNPTPSVRYNKGNVKFAGDAQPVVGVSWFEASAFAALFGWSLPTKTQWEVAAGDLRNPKYSNKTELKRIAHYGVNAKRHATADVKSKRANNYRLYDMLGNVWEWMSNPFYNDKKIFREIRGGSFSDHLPIVVSALFRVYYHTGNQDDGLGFRVVSAASL